MEEKDYSFYLDQALNLLNIADKSSFESIEIRKQKSIELAELIVLYFKDKLSVSEKAKLNKLSKLITFLKNEEAFYSNLIDQTFRSSSKSRIIDQINHLLIQHSISSKSSLILKIKYFFFRYFGSAFPDYFLSLMQKKIIKESLTILNFIEKNNVYKCLQNNKNNESIFWLIQKSPFGRGCVEKNIKNILSLIENPYVESFSINILNLSSNLLSNPNILMCEELEKNLRIILQKALDNPFKVGKEEKQKTIFLTCDLHKHLYILVDVFERILFLKSFLPLKLGITLNAYYPESLEIQKRLVELAKLRIEKNGSPIYIRITKGSFFNLEQIEASKNNWSLPTYSSKIETDANFKKMLDFGCNNENSKAANLVIVDCNIFDIAYSILLIKENKIEPYVFFEITEEKFTKSMRLSLEKLFKCNFKISCPIVNKNEFQLISCFLLNRINDLANSDYSIFYSDLFFPGTKNWEDQIDSYKSSFGQMKVLSEVPKQSQNRNIIKIENLKNFENEPITDFSIPSNLCWANNIIDDAKKYIPEDVPLVINGNYFYDNLEGKGIFPSKPNEYYRYALANTFQIEESIITAKKNEKKWFETSIEKKYNILLAAAQKLREKRGFFIKLLMLDISKSLEQADREISDAIDALEYHCKQIFHFMQYKDIEWTAKGTFVIVPPWGFPVSVGVEAITCALICGNVIIFKPLEECVLISYHLVNLFWEAGVPKECLQFMNCSNELFKQRFAPDERINSIIIFTASNNVRKLIRLRNGLELLAFAGGINTIIVTDMSDKEKAIRDIINSAFEFSGQKFSSAPVLILEKNLYEDLEFQENLKEAASNLITGSSLNPTSIITPLVKMPDEEFKQVFTTLEEGEWWLVEPKVDPDNPMLYSCGIKWGVKPSSFVEKHQIYGPILSVIKAENLDDAIKLSNKSKWGLAAGLHSLDVREHNKWLQEMKVGNYYINSKITDIKIGRQPFGGYKESSFGAGYKSGGPNYMLYFLNARQKSLPKEKQPVNDWVNSLTAFLEKIDLSAEQLGIWYASVANYSYWWKRLKQDFDSCKIIGQDNYLRYLPRKNITLRLTEESFALDALRVCAAALTCSASLEISWSNNLQLEEFNWIDVLPILSNVEESNEEFYKRVETGKIKRLRLTTPASHELKKIASHSACFIIDEPVLANGKFELLHYIKEISVTYNYHRYGNLGNRESEIRRPLL